MSSSKVFFRTRKYRKVYFLAFVSFVNLVFYQIALICMHNCIGIKGKYSEGKIWGKVLVNKFTRQIMNNSILREYFLIRSDNGN